MELLEADSRKVGEDMPRLAAMDSEALQTANLPHRCNWMGCPRTFKDASTLRAHVTNVHFEPSTFAADCRVPGGKWEDWRRAHDADYTFETGQLLVMSFTLSLIYLAQTVWWPQCRVL